MSFNVEGPAPRGRPKLRWKDVINNDLRKRGINGKQQIAMERYHQASDDITDGAPNPPQVDGGGVDTTSK